MPVTSKTYALYKCARMILDDQCPPEREHYLCMKQEDDTGACTQCWDNYLWGLFTETADPCAVDVVGRGCGMKHPPEFYASKSNLMRVAREIAKMNNPELVVSALAQMLATYAGKEAPAPMPGPEGNNAKFNAALNGSKRPQAAYDMLAALAAGKGGPAVKITIAFRPEEERQASTIMSFLCHFLPDTRTHTSTKYAPFTHVYITTKPEKRH